MICCWQVPKKMDLTELLAVVLATTASVAEVTSSRQKHVAVTCSENSVLIMTSNVQWSEVPVTRF
jgi:hypothetical protein